MRVDTTSLGLSADEAQARPYLASMGIYVFKYDRLEESPGGRQDASGFRQGSNSGKHPQIQCAGFLFDGYWEDIGTIRRFLQANLDMTTAIPPFNLFDAEAPLLTRSRYLPPSKIDNCEIRYSIISEGCIINGAKINNSLIGLRSRLGNWVAVGVFVHDGR